jgi:hypothetical protein
MNNLVFLLEEPSARDLLEQVVPKLVSPDTSVHFLVFEGKQDLERNVKRKTQGWLLPRSRFVILRDQDAAQCTAVKERLADHVPPDRRGLTLVRIACRELESWIIGDWGALAKAYDQQKLVANSERASYRDPDLLVRPVEEIRKFIPEYQKRDGARRTGALLDPSTNRSKSFKVFCAGVSRLQW